MRIPIFGRKPDPAMQLLGRLDAASKHLQKAHTRATNAKPSTVSWHGTLLKHRVQSQIVKGVEELRQAERQAGDYPDLQGRIRAALHQAEDGMWQSVGDYPTKPYSSYRSATPLQGTSAVKDSVGKLRGIRTDLKFGRAERGSQAQQETSASHPAVRKLENAQAHLWSAGQSLDRLEGVSLMTAGVHPAAKGRAESQLRKAIDDVAAAARMDGVPVSIRERMISVGERVDTAGDDLVAKTKSSSGELRVNSTSTARSTVAGAGADLSSIIRDAQSKNWSDSLLDETEAEMRKFADDDLLDEAI